MRNCGFYISTFATTNLSLTLQQQKTRHNDESLVVTPRGIEPRFAG